MPGLYFRVVNARFIPLRWVSLCVCYTSQAGIPVCVLYPRVCMGGVYLRVCMGGVYLRVCEREACRVCEGEACWVCEREACWVYYASSPMV